MSAPRDVPPQFWEYLRKGQYALRGVPTAHATTHQPGGTDAMVVDAAAATGSLRTIGTGALQAAAGNDARLINAITQPQALKYTSLRG